MIDKLSQLNKLQNSQSLINNMPTDNAAYFLLFMISVFTVICCRFSIAFREKYRKLHYQKSLQKEASERRKKEEIDIE